MKSFAKLILISVCLNYCFADPADEVLDLPGINKTDIPFKHYSGFLDVGNGRHYHYWFVESQSNPAKDPVILWLNGGPGASSITGFWTENGPFSVESDGKTVTTDPNSWNTLANVLYLESPAGVGYSYSTNKTTFNNEITAQDNYLALEKFFKKFPQFSNNSFYITGESYAGVYIPTLALKIYNNKSKINLKGVAIGNGALDFHMFFNSMVRMAYTHGLISSDEFNDLVKNCCSCKTNGQSCDFANSSSTKCNVYQKLRTRVMYNGINPYNIYSDCRPSFIYSSDSLFYKSMKTLYGLDFKEINNPLNEFSTKSECMSSKYLQYMRDEKVRKALHIPVNLPGWLSGPPIEYSFNINNQTMKPQFKELIEKHKIPTFIVYNGDIDIVCDFMADQQFVDELGYKLIEKYKKWTVGGRTAGFVKRYEGISFMTVRNAGHMVPTDQPEAALAIIKELIGVSKVG